MEKKEFNEKKYEHLTDEELLKVCGGDGELSEVMIMARKAVCENAGTIADCANLGFCTWQVSSSCLDRNSGGKCTYKIVE